MKAQCPSCGTEFECRPPKAERDLMWDTVVEVCRLDTDRMTRSERADVGKTVREVLEAGATPLQLRRGAAAWVKLHRLDTMSVHSLRLRLSQILAAGGIKRDDPVSETQRSAELREVAKELGWI